VATGSKLQLKILLRFAASEIQAFLPVFHFYSVVHAHLFDIPVTSERINVTNIRAHRRGTQKAILCSPGPISKAMQERGLRRTAD